MRTTLTLDDDVAEALERIRKSRDLRMRDLVNEVLRRGLKDMMASPKRMSPFAPGAFRSGACAFLTSTILLNPLPSPKAKLSSDIGRRLPSWVCKRSARVRAVNPITRSE